MKKGENVGVDVRCPNCTSFFDICKSSGECGGCGRLLTVHGNVFDFVGSEVNPKEKQFYDEVYQDPVDPREKQTVNGLKSIWSRQDQRVNALVSETLENVEDKRIVLLGNGSSTKEMNFLQ